MPRKLRQRNQKFDPFRFDEFKAFYDSMIAREETSTIRPIERYEELLKYLAKGLKEIWLLLSTRKTCVSKWLD